MVSLLTDKFGYLLATIQREVEPENVVPHSASFDDIKSMFGNEICFTTAALENKAKSFILVLIFYFSKIGNHFSVHLMEQKKITDSNTKDNTFVIAPDKVSMYL